MVNSNKNDENELHETRYTNTKIKNTGWAKFLIKAA